LFKMMYVGILPYPSLDVSDIVYFNMSKSLKRTYKLNTSTRLKERYDAMCRIYTMIHALELVFNYEMDVKYHRCTHKSTKRDSFGNTVCCDKEAHYGTEVPERCIEHRRAGDAMVKNHAGKPFDPYMLLDVEPYLYCTEEIAIFVFTELSNEIYNPNESKIVNAMFKVVLQKVPKFKTIRNKDNTEGEDFNKLILENIRIGTLVKYIHSNIPVELGKPSEHNIKSILCSLSERSVEHRPYVERKLERAWIKNDVLPRCTYTEKDEPKLLTDCIIQGEKGIEIATELFKQPRIDASRMNTRPIRAVRECSLDGLNSIYVENVPEQPSNQEAERSTWFEEGIIKEEKSDKIGMAVSTLQHKNTREKYILFGNPRMNLEGKITHPNRYKAVLFKKRPGRSIQMSNPLYKNRNNLDIRQRTSMYQDETYRGETIHEDLDEYGCLAHFDKLNMKTKFRDMDHKNIERSTFMLYHLPYSYDEMYKRKCSAIQAMDNDNDFHHKYKSFQQFQNKPRKRQKI
jgi:hypothetical protein